jgi:HD-GYP domain-containing protein (c-di-GMP phosphodiesterase class II)
MITHTIECQKMLNRVGGFTHKVGLIVRSHHERWDGQGYPDHPQKQTSRRAPPWATTPC